MATADYYYPDWECLVDFFFAIRGWKIAGMGGQGIEPTTTTLDLSSQSGAYDLSAIATHLDEKQPWLWKAAKPIKTPLKVTKEGCFELWM